MSNLIIQLILLSPVFKQNKGVTQSLTVYYLVELTIVLIAILASFERYRILLRASEVTSGLKKVYSVSLLSCKSQIYIVYLYSLQIRIFISQRITRVLRLCRCPQEHRKTLFQNSSSGSQISMVRINRYTTVDRFFISSYCLLGDIKSIDCDPHCRLKSLNTT